MPIPVSFSPPADVSHVPFHILVDLSHADALSHTQHVRSLDQQALSHDQHALSHDQHAPALPTVVHEHQPVHL